MRSPAAATAIGSYSVRRALLCVLAVACSKHDGPPAAGSAAAPPPAPVLVPPGLGVQVTLPPPVDGDRAIEPRKFRHSSVRGDFRVYRTAAGILTAWKTRLSARTVDGKPLWKREGQGRAVAISADGTKLVTNNDAGETLVLDTKTGAPLGPATRLGGGDDDVWISAFAWLPDGKHILALDFKHAFVLRGDGTRERELPIECKESCFFSGAVALSNAVAIVANAASSSTAQLLKIALADGKTLGAADYDGHDPDLTADGKRFVVDGFSGVAVFETATLQPRWTVAMPGYRGVRAATWPEGSDEQWTPMPKLSPNGNYVAVNDHAGRLWLLDARDGAPAIAYPTELVDFVEDVMWLDDATLIVIDNPGHVLRIAGTPPAIAWSQPDAPDDARWDGP